MPQKIGSSGGGGSSAFQGFAANAALGQVISSATWATVTNWASENHDTNNWFNTTTGRFQPDIAGYYALKGIMRLTDLSNNAGCYARFYKNGTTTIADASTTQVNGNNAITVLEWVEYFNGTTDFVDMQCTHYFDTGTATVHLASRFSGYYIGA